VKSGKLVSLGVGSAERSALTPELPTIAEAGVPGYEAAVSWYGILAPAGTDEAIVNKLDREIQRILQLPDVKERFVTLGFEHVASGTPRKFAAYIESDVARWAKVMKDANIHLD
jgi:tripartite-type tricarboxylate transporter receptor subunit TctC